MVAGVRRTSDGQCDGLGDGMGGEADFSAALLTKCVSSFGRNDDSVVGGRKPAKPRG